MTDFSRYSWMPLWMVRLVPIGLTISARTLLVLVHLLTHYADWQSQRENRRRG